MVRPVVVRPLRGASMRQVMNQSERLGLTSQPVSYDLFLTTWSLDETGYGSDRRSPTPASADALGLQLSDDERVGIKVAPRLEPKTCSDFVSQNVTFKWIQKVNPPTRSSTYCLLLLIVNNKLTILWGS